MKTRESTAKGASLRTIDKALHNELTPAQPDAGAAPHGTSRDDPTHDQETAAIDARTLQTQVYEALATHFSYPPLARQNGWQGEVRLALRIEPNGEIGRIRVLASSGYGILDRAALRSLKAVGRLPRAQDLLKGSGFDLILPVRYRLLDG